MSDRIQDARQPFVRIDFGVMDRLPELGPLALAVYAVLGMHASAATSTCFPGRKKIAKEARVSERAVDAALKMLADAGCIAITPRYIETAGGGAVRTSNLYTILQVSRVAQEMPQGGALYAPRVGQVMPQGGAGGAHRTRTIEPAPVQLASSEPIVSRRRSVSQPAPLDDDDADQGISSAVPVQDHETLEAIRCLLAPISPARLATVLAAVRKAAPTADAEDIEAAADEWADRWDRIKGRAPDPITASQLPAVVAAYVKASRTASRAGHGLVPMIER